jgi:hypothetical protein
VIETCSNAETLGRLWESGRVRRRYLARDSGRAVSVWAWTGFFQDYLLREVLMGEGGEASMRCRVARKSLRAGRHERTSLSMCRYPATRQSQIHLA